MTGKIILVSVIVLLLLTESCAQTKGIDFFEGTWSEALAKAKAEKKPVFLDAYATWCGPCKMMERDVFTDPAVAEYFNEKFIAIRIDMERGEGPALARRLPSIDGYPSLLFFGSDGYLTKTLLGSRNASDFLAEARLVGK